MENEITIFEGYCRVSKKYSEVEDMQQTVVLKRFKSFDEMPELFISEVSNC